MLRYLNGESNVKGGPNENYGREFMELFTLGVNARHHGRQELQRERRRAAREVVHRLVHRRQGSRQRQVAASTPAAGSTARSRCSASSATTTPTAAVDLVLSAGRPRAVPRQEAVGRVHARRRPPTAVLQQLATDYTAGGRKIKPLVRSILTNPQLFESIDEPNMIKPPVVFVSGALRALGLGVTSSGPRRLPRLDGPAPLLPADRGGLGGRALVAQHEHRAGALRLRRRRHRQRAERLAGEGRSTFRTRRRRRPSTAPTAPSDRPGCPPARARPSRTTPTAPR